MIRREECREEEAIWGREKARIFSVSLHPELISKLFSSQWQKGEPASDFWQDSRGRYWIAADSLVAGGASGQIGMEIWSTWVAECRVRKRNPTTEMSPG